MWIESVLGHCFLACNLFWPCQFSHWNLRYWVKWDSLIAIFETVAKRTYRGDGDSQMPAARVPFAPHRIKTRRFAPPIGSVTRYARRFARISASTTGTKSLYLSISLPEMQVNATWPCNTSPIKNNRKTLYIKWTSLTSPPLPQSIIYATFNMYPTFNIG